MSGIRRRVGLILPVLVSVLAAAQAGPGAGGVPSRTGSTPASPPPPHTSPLEEDELRTPPASPYVALDSWVYDAFEKLAGMNLVDSDFRGQRPWTVRECRRLAEEAEEKYEAEGGSAWPRDIIRALLAECPEDEAKSASVQIEKIYARMTGVAGPELEDGYHFGESFPNDFGRSTRRGVNGVLGVTFAAQAQNLLVHVRAEFQHAPDRRPLPPSALAAMQRADGAVPRPRISGIDRLNLLDAYISYPVFSWQVSLGRQSVWWGPGRDALLFSNNAEPVMMLRFSRTHPAVLPWIFRRLGPYRSEFFVGRLDGHRTISNFRGVFGPDLRIQPLIHGQKLSFKPTPNFEFGVSATTIFAGDGVPLNLRTFIRSFSIRNALPGAPNDPGDRRTGFDFRYRLPGLRKWVTLYNDSMTEDEFSPLGYPRRSAMNPGLFISQLPRLERLDLALEAAYTALPNLRNIGSYYFNDRYKDGYTNQGKTMGHWVGRDGVSYFGSARYWLTPQRVLDLAFRKTTIDRRFLLGGGNASSVRLQGRWATRAGLELQWMTQYEQWLIPVLSPKRESNVATSFQVNFFPGKRR